MEDGIEHRVPSARVSPEGTLEPAQHGAAHFNTSTQEQTHLSDHTGGLSGSAATQAIRSSLESAGEDRVLLQAAVSPDASDGQTAASFANAQRATREQRLSRAQQQQQQPRLGNDAGSETISCFLALSTAHSNYCRWARQYLTRQAGIERRIELCCGL